MRSAVSALRRIVFVALLHGREQARLPIRAT
jgi:hypothetical protein